MCEGRAEPAAPSSAGRGGWRPGRLVALLFVLAGVAGCVSLSCLGTGDPLAAGDRALGAAQVALAAAPPVVLAEGPLQAGWSRRCITPERSLGLFGCGARRGARSTGVADDLFVKALVLDNGGERLLVFTADLLVMPEALTAPVRREVAAALPVDGSAVLFSATHTHAAPSPWDGWAPGVLAGGRYDARYGESLHAAFVAAAREALANLGPARVASAVADGGPFAGNRARPGQAIDGGVRFLLFERATGERCLLVNTPSHGTVLGGRNLLVSGDWPGWLQRHLERTPGVFAMAQAGAVGSVRPVPPEVTDADLADVLAEARRHGQGVAEVPGEAERAQWADFARACALGRAVAGRIQAQAASLAPVERARLAHTVLNWRLPPARIYLLGSRPLPAWLAAWLGIAADTACQGLHLQDVVLEGIGGELSSELLLPLAAAARQRGAELWVSSFSWDYKGYVSPDSYYLGGPGGKGGYETRDMAWFGPRAGACFTAVIGGQLEQVAAAPAR